ncbi:MAG: hypothetical protein K6U89_19250, partial [Chloroflexi bacterium]|nr:hypothetical protein [Chloroflexota bacterium]
MADVSRRSLMLGAAALTMAGASPEEDVVGQPMRPWRPGGLDIHHIATGRGDSTLIIGPDGSSLMIDAGASSTPPPAGLDIRPGPERRAGEWIGRYARRHLVATKKPKLDTFLTSHLHPDHIDGLGDIAALLPIGLLIDRDYPD